MENIKVEIRIKEVLKKRGISQVQLAKMLGISEIKLSRILNGVSIKFDMLAKLCVLLNVEPGDILHVNEGGSAGSIIPMFLDYSGTTDKLLSGGVENLRNFFQSILALERKTNKKVKIIMVTGSSLEAAKSKFTLLNDLAMNYGLQDLFLGVVSEYCGYFSTEDQTMTLMPISAELIQIRPQVQKVLEIHGAHINSKNTTFINSYFDAGVSRVELASACEDLERLLRHKGLAEDIEVLSYYDEYGKEIDVKPKTHTKASAVGMCIEILKKKYDVRLVVIGGDSQVEDLSMYTENKECFESIGILPVFIAPRNIGDVKVGDKNIFIGCWENAEGIISAIQTLTERIITTEDGGFHL